MKENIEVLEELKDKLCNWKCYDETELQILMNEFEKFPRKEFSLNYTPIFTNNILIENIVEIGKVFHSNKKNKYKRYFKFGLYCVSLYAKPFF